MCGLSRNVCVVHVGRYKYFLEFGNMYEVVLTIMNLLAIIFWVKFVLRSPSTYFDVNEEKFVDRFDVRAVGGGSRDSFFRNPSSVFAVAAMRLIHVLRYACVCGCVLLSCLSLALASDGCGV